jgi:PPK2 family polyphosphate:nucleotide phosphotransferase
MDKKLLKQFQVTPGTRVKLSKFDPGWEQTEKLAKLGKQVVRERAEEILAACIPEVSEAQDLLYADNRYALLVIFQAMDAAGKDGTIKHVMSGINPQGCQVFCFKTPSAEEVDHTFLWRYQRCLPERGRIGIFNRSYYEDVLITKVHPGILDAQDLTVKKYDKTFWKKRYSDINALERHLVRNGTVVVKFFLNVSKDEQKKRFMDRLNKEDKHWKFSLNDMKERAYWDDYQVAYEQMLSATSSKYAPWYVVPADHKWVTRAVVASVLTQTINSLDLSYPKLTPDQIEALAAARSQLEAE